MKLFQIPQSIVVGLLLTITSIASAQTANYGFTSSKVPLSSLPVRSASNMITTPTHVYFINGIDSKIYDTHWDDASSTWTTASAPLGGTSCPYVKFGTNIVNYGDQLFFIAAVDSRIYSLQWVNSTIGWQYSLLIPGQATVTGTQLTLNTHTNGCEIYYVSNGKICQLYFNGTNWTGGTQLSSAQSVNALSTCSLVVTDIHVYFIGTDNKVYDILWNGTGWTNGFWPLVSAATTVRTGCNISNNGNSLFYTDVNSKVVNLFYTSSWQSSVLPNQGSTNVRSSSDIVQYDGSIFYFNSVDNHVWRLWQTGSAWNNSVLVSTSDPAKAGSPMYVWSNDIYEEGSTTQTFKSYHVFYNGNDNRINMCIYDDAICTIFPFSCMDPCDANGNGTGWDTPTNPNVINANGGYDCAACLTAGKKWYYGKVPTTSTSGSGPIAISCCDKQFFYTGITDNKVYSFLRNVVNGQSRPGHPTPSWQEEFNASTLDPTRWFAEFDWGNHGPNRCYDNYYNENTAQNSGTLILTALKKNPLVSRTWSCWYGQCGYGMFNETKNYEYTSGMAGTRSGQGNNSITYGYVESRLKLPRGKDLWSGFWLYSETGTTGQDINVVEAEGNGKVFISSAYDHSVPYRAPIPTYAVGYRFYDDYYTYGVDWRTDSIVFYLNNERVGGYATANYFNTSHQVYFTMEMDTLVRAHCEAEIFPANFYVDNVRAWGSTVSNLKLVNPNSTHAADDIKTSYTIFPNPGQTNITLDGPKMSKVEIFNAQGSKVGESVLETIDIQNFTSGIYFLRITDNIGNVHYNKIIKE